MYKKVDIRFFIILLPLLLVFAWLFMEKPGFYGDETTHYSLLVQALNNIHNAPDILSKLVAFYVFNQAYPPLFYAFSLPFINLFSDTILGMRVYVGVLFVVCYFVFYKLLRIHLSRKAALSGCLFLCTSYIFVFSGRFYFIEVLLLLETLVFCYFLLMNYKTKKNIFLFLAGFVLSLGLLTKFNFVIYAGPIALVYYGILFFSLKKRDGRAGKILVNMAQLAISPVLISSPWYFYNIYSQGGFGALSAVNFFYQIGLVQKNDTAKSFMDGAITYFKTCLPMMSFVMLFVFMMAWGISILSISRKNMGDRLLRIGSDDDSHEKVAYLWMPLIFIAIVTIYVTYMGMPPRWNLSYAFLAMIFAFFSEKLPLKVKSLFLISSSVIFFILIFNSYVLSLIPMNTHYLLPDPLPAGPEEVVDIVIKDSERRYVKKFDGVIFGIIGPLGYLDPRAIDYFTAKNSFDAEWLIPSYWENPAGAEIFFASDYLIYTPDNLGSDSVSMRYKYILDHLPLTYKACLSRVATLKSKAGQIVVDNLDKNCVTPQAKFDLIEVGRKYDENTSFEIFWELDFENTKLEWEGSSGLFSEYQKDYGNLSNKLELEKSNLPFNYYSIAKTRLELFYKNAHILLKWNENLLLNSSFEEERNGLIVGWMSGDLRHVVIDKSGIKSHSGMNAVKIARQDASLVQQVQIDSGQVYLLRQYTRTSKSGQKAALQILWLNDNSDLIKADIVYYNSTFFWSEHKIVVFPPPDSKYAVIYVTVFEEHSVWFDDISFQGAEIINK